MLRKCSESIWDKLTNYKFNSNLMVNNSNDDVEKISTDSGDDESEQIKDDNKDVIELEEKVSSLSI